MTTQLITNGLIFHIEPFNDACFTPIDDTGGINTKMKNLADNGQTSAILNMASQSLFFETPTGSVGTNRFDYEVGTGSIRMNNMMSSDQNNTCLILPPLTNLVTFSVWIYFDTSSQLDKTRYLISSPSNWNWRIIGAPDNVEFPGFNTSRITGWQGAHWFGREDRGLGFSNYNPFFIENGSIKKDAFWSNIETQGVWRNLTFIAANPVTTAVDYTLFGFDKTKEGLNCRFGPITMYNRALSMEEINQNYMYYVARFINKGYLQPTTPSAVLTSSPETSSPETSSLFLDNSTTSTATSTLDSSSDFGSLITSFIFNSSQSTTSTGNSKKSKINLLYIIIPTVVGFVAIVVIALVAFKNKKKTANLRLK